MKKLMPLMLTAFSMGPGILEIKRFSREKFRVRRFSVDGELQAEENVTDPEAGPNEEILDALPSTSDVAVFSDYDDVTDSIVATVGDATLDPVLNEANEEGFQPDIKAQSEWDSDPSLGAPAVGAEQSNVDVNVPNEPNNPPAAPEASSEDPNNALKGFSQKRRPFLKRPHEEGVKKFSESSLKKISELTSDERSRLQIGDKVLYSYGVTRGGGIKQKVGSGVITFGVPLKLTKLISDNDKVQLFEAEVVKDVD